MRLQTKTNKLSPNCRSCNSVSLKVSSIRKNFPVYIWPLPEGEVTKLEDVILYVCVDCGHMQLQHMDQNFISEIYRNEAFNIENIDQNKNRYSLITKNDPSILQNTKILEIGGGRNSFLSVLPKTSEKWVADFSVDENILSITEGAFIGDFVDIKIKQKDFDYIFMFHVFEHFNRPGLVLEKIRELLKIGGSLIIEVPNFSVESEKIPYYTLFHMHISLFTKKSLISFLERYGFTCNNFYINNDVLLAEFCLNGCETSSNFYGHNLSYVSNLEYNIANCRLKLKNIFRDMPSGKVAIFGAGGATTLFLYNFPFLIEEISCALDNDKNKIGRFICNGKIPIVPPKDIKRMGIDFVIVLHDSHIDHIANKNVNYININKVCHG